jgi:solute carrier family 39 (zinc transporter), member 1/2/3
VILGTAFLHLLPEATHALTDACLPSSWTEYKAYAGLFALLSILAMQLIEFIAFHFMHDTTHDHHGHSHALPSLDDQKTHRISTYLLEFGLVIHSVLIGLALGTEDGSAFVALFIALSFHQFFEGFALGAHIAKLNSKSILPAIIMVLLYALATPVGVAIGIGVHSNNYNRKSTAALIASGVFGSVAAGILIYVSLINLIAGEMSASIAPFFALSKRLKFLYFLALYLGVTLMAILARWA